MYKFHRLDSIVRRASACMQTHHINAYRAARLMAVGVSAAMNIRPRPTQAARADTCRNFIVGKEGTVHKRLAAVHSLADFVRTWLRTFGCM